MGITVIKLIHSVIGPGTGQPIIPPAAIQRLLYQIFKVKAVSVPKSFPLTLIWSAVTKIFKVWTQCIQGDFIDGRNAGVQVKQ